MIDPTDAVLAAIDGALMDPEIPDGMRWSPTPEQVSDPDALPYDGRIVPQPPQTYEPAQPSVMPRGTAARRDLRRAYLSMPCARLTHATCTDAGDCFCTCHDAPPALTPRRPLPAPHSDAERPRPPLPPGGSMLLAALRAERAEERARLIAAGAPTLALPLDPDTLVVDEYPGRVVVHRMTAAELQEAMGEACRRFTEAMVPLFDQVGEAFRGIGETLAAAGITPLGPPTTPQARRDLGLPALSPEEIRTAALDARRHRNTGPALLGPEQSRPPRRIR